MPPRGFLGQGCKSLRKNQGVASEIVFGDYFLVDALQRWLKVRKACENPPKRVTGVRAGCFSEPTNSSFENLRTGKRAVRCAFRRSGLLNDCPR